MDGYMAEYGEGFLGIGYSHPSVTDHSGPTGIGTQSNADSCDNSSDLVQYGGENGAQPVFVAAQIQQGRNTSTEQPHIPDGRQQQQQQQLEKEAGLARSKAQDILRNILNGIQNDGSTVGAPVSAHPNQANGDNGDSSNGNLKNNDNYYGPHESYSNASLIPSNITNTARIPEPSISSIESDAQAARMKAQDILRKFQSQTDGNGNADAVGALTNQSNTSHPSTDINGVVHRIQQHYNEFHTPQNGTSQSKPQSPIPPAGIPATVPVPVPQVTTPPWEHARRRRESLAKDEERKQRALFKNLQYVARLEEERLAKQLVEVQQVKTLEQQMDERYQQKMEYRIRKRNNINNGSNNINTSGAGIGTKQRRKAEAKRQKTALPPSLRNKQQGSRGDNNKSRNNKNDSDSVAIYVSNLPTDGSIDEPMIQGLFSAYGSLRKVHFYVDKITGRKKGDALIIYALTKGKDQVSFTQSVCSQVGAYWDRVVDK